MEQAVEQIRIVLAELPRMLRDIVSDTITRQSDMLVVDELPRRRDRPASGRRRGVDVVITGLEDGRLDERYTQLMQADPRLKVLGITVDGRRAFLFELRPRRILLGDVSPDGLLDAIRSTARSEDA